ncbi:MAG: amidohydrolase [Bacteroidetes bacterium]|nr:amidohydrolase [Bacteroidota bacterium]
MKSSKSEIVRKIRKCNLLFLYFLLSTIYSCTTRKEKVDLIVHNAVVYTVDSSFSTAESFAVKSGKIIAVGTNDSILAKYDGEKLDAQGKAVFPGLIDAHCHFYGYGLGLKKVDLVGTKSFDEVIQRVIEFSKSNHGEWIQGRGWDQNDWDIKEFPDKRKLDSLFPNTPVFLKRIDGHAALVNSEALRRANITFATQVDGGALLFYEGEKTSGGSPAKITGLTGILLDNAMDLVAKIIPAPSKEEMKAALLAAQKNCFAVGLTTVDDAGLEKQIVDLIDEMQKNDELKMRVYAMLTDNKENLDYYLQHGIYKTDRLNVRSFKFYADGALGSRGACLLEDYSDKKCWKGFLLSKPEYFKEMAKKMFEKGFQMNTHCIGDSAIRFILNTYTNIIMDRLKKESQIPSKIETRWRIEHCQVLSKKDIEDSKPTWAMEEGMVEYSNHHNVILSVQPTHATSDMYWAKDRLGEERIKYAYAYKDLLKAAGMVALGTDFPVENINPMYTFYAAVARKDLKGFPEGGFQMENALTREETLKGMTIWAAYANFEEKEKGSIEKNKFADFIILDKDIMKINMDEVPNVKVIYTFVNGEKVYSSESNKK